MYVIAIEDENQPLGFKLFSGFMGEEAKFDAPCAFSYANQQKTFKALVFMGYDYGRQELKRYSALMKDSNYDTSGLYLMPLKELEQKMLDWTHESNFQHRG
jgi:hypothetical protein